MHINSSVQTGHRTQTLPLHTEVGGVLAAPLSLFMISTPDQTQAAPNGHTAQYLRTNGGATAAQMPQTCWLRPIQLEVEFSCNKHRHSVLHTGRQACVYGCVGQDRSNAMYAGKQQQHIIACIKPRMSSNSAHRRCWFPKRQAVLRHTQPACHSHNQPHRTTQQQSRQQQDARGLQMHAQAASAHSACMRRLPLAYH